MVFVAIHLAFLVFGITGFGVLLAFTEVRPPFLGPGIGASLRLPFGRVVFFLRSNVRRRNGESGRR
jgi:hypothetical protein